MPNGRPKPRKLAVFDIDGTVFRSSLLIELVSALIEEKIFPPETAKLYERARLEWLDRQGSYDDYISFVIAAFRKHLKGVKYGDLRRVAYKVVAKEKGRVYRYTRDLIKSLKSRGYYLVAVSHSPKIVVEGFGKTLGFSKIYGIMYETDGRGFDGRFTGNVLYPEIVIEKDKLVQRVLDGSGGGLTLKGSVGVGDTESDIPFLKMASRAVCFNPNAKLYKEAKRNGWEIVVERKDVIYKLPK